VIRPSEHYAQLLRHSYAPAHLHNGCDWSIEFDFLSRCVFDDGASVDARAVTAAERLALEELDVPHFDAVTDDTWLGHGGLSVAPDYFAASGYSRVVDRCAALSDADLAWQARIIEGSVHAWRARSETHVESVICPSQPSGGPRSDATESWRRARFLARANAIAEVVVSDGARNPDGSVTWAGLSHLPASGRYQLQPVGNGLYGGRCGIALFLAACDLVNRSDAHRTTVYDALQPLRRLVRNTGGRGLAQFVPAVGIGVADGIGGAIYALTCIGEWCRDNDLLDDAEALAVALSPDVIAADRRLDVIGGAAGAILGLMKLHRVRPSPAVASTARGCADWLCRHQIVGGDSAGAWETLPDSRPLTGFAHGAAGIAHALARLHAVTGEPALMAAARAALEFEFTAFLPGEENWIDFRRSEPGAPPSCRTAWCHGAPGIALARLALLSELAHPRLSPDLDAALKTTLRQRRQAGDHLCCGNFGRFDILLHAARVLGREDLSAAASEQAYNVLERSDTFRTVPCDVPVARSPGFFDGLAGIGYVLLRLGSAGNLPCVLAWE